MKANDIDSISPWAVIRALRRRGLHLEVDDGDLCLVGDPAALVHFPNLRETLAARKAELLAALAAEQSKPIEGYNYRPLPGPVTPWPAVPFKVPPPCARCKRVAWPSDGAERLVTGDTVCHWCVTPADVVAGSVPIAEEGRA